MNRPLAPGARLASTGVYTRAGTRVVDLREVPWVDPVHLVSVAALAEAAQRDGLAFRLRGPSAPQRARYAARMQLGTVVTALGGEHDLPDPPAPAGAQTLVEVARLDTPIDMRRLAEHVYDRVAERDTDLAHALHQGISELGQNVFDHARSVGYVAAQTIPRRGELRFAVADPGVGLLATLTGEGARSDRSAIDLALAGVSRLGRRGTGLPQTVGAVARLGGHFYLASGGAATTITPRRRVHSTGSDFRGTIVEGRVPTNRTQGTMDADAGGAQHGQPG
jgi:hypothetical protein